MMTTSSSKNCKKCQAKVKHENSLAEVESQKTSSRSTLTKKSLHPLFRKYRRPQIRREKVGPVKTNSQKTTVDLSVSMKLPESNESSSASSFITSKQNHEQAFSTFDVNSNDFKSGSDPQLMRVMSTALLQKPTLIKFPGKSIIVPDDKKSEREKRDENEKSKDEYEKGEEEDDLPHPSRIIARSSESSGPYRRPSQLYLECLYESHPGIDSLLERRKTIPPIQGTSPLTFEARNRVNASDYDESILDSYFHHRRTPLVGPNCLDKMVSLSNSARSQVVKHLVQDRKWYDRKQAEIKARGGRKGQWAKIVTKEMFEERLAKGWNKHQNKPILGKEQKNGDDLLKGFGFPENIQPVMCNGKLAMADSTLFIGGRPPNRTELILGVNVWISQDE